MNKPTHLETGRMAIDAIVMAVHAILLRDAVIGAIALTKGYSPATRKTEHFKKIAGLNLACILSV